MLILSDDQFASIFILQDSRCTCCFCRHVKDVEPRPLDPHETLQHFKIANYISGSSFFARVVPNAFPQYFFEEKRMEHAY